MRTGGATRFVHELAETYAVVTASDSDRALAVDRIIPNVTKPVFSKLRTSAQLTVTVPTASCNGRSPLTPGVYRVHFVVVRYVAGRPVSGEKPLVSAPLPMEITAEASTIVPG